MSGVDEYFTSGGVFGGAFDVGAWVPDYQSVNYDCIAMAIIVVVIIWVMYKVYCWVTGGSESMFDAAGAARPCLSHTGSKDCEDFSGGQEVAVHRGIMDNLGATDSGVEGMVEVGSTTQRELAWEKEGMEDQDIDPTLFGDTCAITGTGAKGITYAQGSARTGIHDTPGTEDRCTANQPQVSSFTDKRKAESDFELAMNGGSVN